MSAHYPFVRQPCIHTDAQRRTIRCTEVDLIGRLDVDFVGDKIALAASRLVVLDSVWSRFPKQPLSTYVSKFVIRMPKVNLLKLAMAALLLAGCGIPDGATSSGGKGGASADSTGKVKPAGLVAFDDKNLDPSLCAFVLQAELDRVQKFTELKNSSTSFMGGGSLPRDTPDRIFFALAGSDGNWVAPPDSLIAEIGIESVRSAREIKGSDPVYFLSNFHWVNSHTVVLDMENIQGDVHSAMREMKLSNENGAWRVLDEGRYWGTDSAVDDIFKSHSNSGIPVHKP